MLPFAPAGVGSQGGGSYASMWSNCVEAPWGRLPEGEAGEPGHIWASLGTRLVSRLH